jgi:hypothetical protein
MKHLGDVDACVNVSMRRTGKDSLTFWIIADVSAENFVVKVNDENRRWTPFAFPSGTDSVTKENVATAIVNSCEARVSPKP